MKDDAKDQEDKKSPYPQASASDSHPSEAPAAFITAILDIFADTTWHPTHTEHVAIEAPRAEIVMNFTDWSCTC